MLGQDQDDDIRRLESFSVASTETELTSKAAKQKKKKRDPSPLSRMGSSLLRPFTKGLSKLRTSRSSDKDGRLQAQSRIASQSDSLASRATSASTLDDGVPSRINSISLQPQIQTAHGAKAAAGRSESFRFNSPATHAPPDLAAEPSFAQDLPHNSRASHQSSVLPAKPAAAAPVAADTAPRQTRTQPADRHGAVPGLSSPSFAQAGHSSDDDEFSYDFSQTESWPVAGQCDAASASAAAVSQPRSATTSSAKPEAAVSRDSKAGSGTNTKLSLEADPGGLSGRQVAGSGPEKSRGSFVEAGTFRPQLSRAERPQLAIAIASVYSPLEVGAATSPTMCANANDEGIKGKPNPLLEAHVKASSGAESTSPASTPPPAAAAAEVSGKQRLGVALQNSVGDAQGATHSQPSRDRSTQGSLPAATLQAASAGGRGRQASSSGDHTAGQKTPGQMASSSVSGAAAQGPDSLSAESLSSASSAGSSEFDILEAVPYQSPHDRSTFAHAVQKEAASLGQTGTAQLRAEQYNVQGSGYSTSPILGPASSQAQPSEDGDRSSTAVLGSAPSQAGGATRPALPAVSQPSASVSPSQQPHENLAGVGQVSAQARLTSPRKGFSDKPILAVYSRRPSADEEATQDVTRSSRRQQQSSDYAMQAKVPYTDDTCMNRCLVSFQSWPLLQHQMFSMYIIQNDCLLPACIANLTVVQAASALSQHIQTARPTYALIWDVVPLPTAMLLSACHDTKVSVLGCLFN